MMAIIDIGQKNPSMNPNKPLKSNTLMPDVNLPPAKSRQDQLEELLKFICDQEGIPIWKVMEKSRKADRVRVRAIFAGVAYKSKMKFTHQEIANCLKIDRSSATHLINNVYHQYET